MKYGRKAVGCVTLLFLLSSPDGFSQDQLNSILTSKDFLRRVTTHHPLAKGAELRPQQANALLRSARGAFDPVVGGSISAKDFDSKEYYDIRNIGLKVPTWFGASVNAGFEENTGQFLDPERTTPANGLGYAGVTLSFGEGLFMDKRRAELAKARIAKDLNEAERRLMLNELRLKAGVSYWYWFAAFHSKKVQEEAMIAARTRFEAVRRSAALGAVPSIDTVEAGIQLQNRIISLQQVEVELQNAAAQLEVYLWSEGLIPLELDSLTIPESLSSVELSEIPDTLKGDLTLLLDEHPVIVTYNASIEQGDISRRWAMEQLKPTVDLKYNALTGRVGEGDLLSGFNTNDRTWGVDVELPLFLRRERGELELAKLKLQDLEFKRLDQRRKLEFGIRMTLNEWELSVDQYALFSRNALDSESLLEGERRLFNLGESSLFMVNSREMGYIKAQLNAIKSMRTNKVSRLKMFNALGVLDNAEL
jgi:outer membrane protein TolC